MYYEINVAREVKKTYEGGPIGYKHLFATARRSCQSEQECATVLSELVRVFPKPKYSISVTRCDETEYGVDNNALLKTLKKKK